MSETEQTAGQPATHVQTPAHDEHAVTRPEGEVFPPQTHDAAPPTESGVSLRTPTPEEAAQIVASLSAKAEQQKPTMGRIVIVRQSGHHDAPGIVVEVLEDGRISCQVFRGTHIPHVGSQLSQIDATHAEAEGWFWPPRA